MYVNVTYIISRKLMSTDIITVLISGIDFGRAVRHMRHRAAQNFVCNP
jgi:hypothetical protein